MRTISLKAPAKVNLYLRVGSLLPDGYHTLDTVFHAIDLADSVTIAPADSYSLTCDIDLGVSTEDNIVTRAVRAMEDEFERVADVRVAVEKHIPHGAGLGGGSSDAAAAIRGLAHLWGLDPNDERLTQVARRIGADVPFFLGGAAGAYKGRGDVLDRPLPALRSAIVIVKVPDHVSTAEAYAALDADTERDTSGNSRAMRDALRFGDVADVGALLRNDFTPAIAARIPRIGTILEELRATRGVLGAEMSGSGSAVFALTETDGVAESVAQTYHRQGLFTYAGRLALAGVTILI